MYVWVPFFPPKTIVIVFILVLQFVLVNYFTGESRLEMSKESHGNAETKVKAVKIERLRDSSGKFFLSAGKIILTLC